VSTISAFLVSVFAAFLLEYHEKLPQGEKLLIRDMKKQLFTFRRSGKQPVA